MTRSDFRLRANRVITNFCEHIRSVVEKGGGTSLASNPAFWAVVASVVVAVIAAWETSRRAAAARAAVRRTELATRYGDALSDVLAWCELPYRIARRTSDDAATLGAVAEMFHVLHERIDHHQRWLQLDSREVGDAYAALVSTTKTRTAPLIASAYARAPVMQPADMTLGDAVFDVDVDTECAGYVGAAETHLNEVIKIRLFGRSSK